MGQRKIQNEGPRPEIDNVGKTKEAAQEDGHDEKRKSRRVRRAGGATNEAETIAIGNERRKPHFIFGRGRERERERGREVPKSQGVQS